MVDSVAFQIRSGVHDADLEDIALSVQARRDTLARRTFNKLEIGDTVRFVSTIRPTYLRGRMATVEGFRIKKLVVRPVDGPMGRFRGSITVPPQLIEIVP